MDQKRTGLTHCFFLLLTFLFCLNLTAQEIEITGQIIDKSSGEGVPYANLLVLKSLAGVTTNEFGQFRLLTDELPLQVRVSSLGFQTDTITFTTAKWQQIQLQPMQSDLPLIEIRAKQSWEVLDESAFVPVDFAINQQRAFLLSRKGISQQYRLAAFTAEGEALGDWALEIGKINAIESNCLNQLFLMTADFAIQLDFVDGELIPVEKIALAEYQSLFAFCKGSTSQQIFLERSNLQGLHKLYLAGDRSNGSIRVFKEVVYKEVLADYRRSYSRIYQGAVILNNGEITYEENQAIRASQEDSDHMLMIAFNNNHQNHLFVQNDTLVLFNFDEDVIETFIPDGELLSTVPIGFNHHKKVWHDAIVMDPVTHKFFTLQKEEGTYHLLEINMENGNTQQRYPLELVDYHQIEILNNQVFILGLPQQRSIAEHPRFMQRILNTSRK